MPTYTILVRHLIKLVIGESRLHNSFLQPILMKIYLFGAIKYILQHVKTEVW